MQFLILPNFPPLTDVKCVVLEEKPARSRSSRRPVHHKSPHGSIWDFARKCRMHVYMFYELGEHVGDKVFVPEMLTQDVFSTCPQIELGGSHVKLPTHRGVEHMFWACY